MKNLLLILSLALTVSACSKETPDVDTTEQQYLIVGHWQHYRLIDNDGNQMGEVMDTSRISNVARRGFRYYSSDGKFIQYEISHGYLSYIHSIVEDYLVVSHGNDVLVKCIYNSESYEHKITLLTENNLNIQYKYYTACYVRADWAAEVYESGLLPQ